MINVSRIAEVEGHEPSNPALEAELQVLKNITLLETLYSHLIAIEAPLHPYERLLNETSIQRLGGDIYLVKPAFSCPREQTTSSQPDWLRF